jgi:mono/diheme cytochrome c family protein
MALWNSYLKGTPPAPSSPARTLTADERDSGRALHDKYCDECHMSTGRGALRKGPAVAGSPVVQAEDPASLNQCDSPWGGAIRRRSAGS